MPMFETAEFCYAPSPHVPFRDKAVLERMRAIGRADFESHPNPNLTVKTYKDNLEAIELVRGFIKGLQ